MILEDSTLFNGDDAGEAPAWLKTRDYTEAPEQSWEQDPDDFQFMVRRRTVQTPV